MSGQEPFHLRQIGLLVNDLAKEMSWVPAAGPGETIFS